MKKLTKLNGVKALSKKEQKSINGGNPSLNCGECGFKPGYMLCYINGGPFLMSCDRR